MKRLVLILMFLISYSSSVFCFDMKGIVVSVEGKPLADVSVVTDIAGVGTQTNAEGIYFLLFDDRVARVTFSSVGYKSRQFQLIEMPDTVILKRQYYREEDILVRTDRAEIGISPVAFDNFSQDEIERDYTVGEFPLLLRTTPNLYSYSDGGASLGYSYTRIRGFDDKRIVTYINGVPLNDPEDHATYFVDLPDFAANVSDIQVQRGVGNSLYGDASFGGTINIVTNNLSRERGASVTFGYGEYTSDGNSVGDIYKQSVDYNSGLIDGRWYFSGRFSKQKTGGYRYHSWYNGWAYYFALARIDPKMTTQLYIYGGPMQMHLSYWGSPRNKIEIDRRTNPLTYDNETDNFNQPHYHLHNIYNINEKMTFYNTLYYIRGKGYYEQFKGNKTFSDYNIDQSLIDLDTTGLPFTKGNLVRQQWVEKNQYGWNPRLDIEHNQGMHSVGGSFYFFESDHLGQVVWAEHINGALSPRHKYYQYYGKKYVSSIYSQEYYEFTENWSGQLTAQIRYQKYDFVQEKMGAFEGYKYNVDWLFFSPRAGINYTLDKNLSFYANLSIASRTPSDAAIYDANDSDVFPSLEIESVSLSTSGDTIAYQFGAPTAKSERVYDFELGGEYRQTAYSFGFNLFWMEFKNEIIPYGGINESGIAFTTNAKRSVHAGVELTTSYKPHKDFTVSGNFAFNSNRIKDYTDTIDVYTNDWSSSRDSTIDFADKKIPAFPDYLGNIITDYNNDKLRAAFQLRFVGKQFMELFNIDSLAIEPYVFASFSLSYKLKNFAGLGNLVFVGRIDNLFDTKYETSGYGWSYGRDDQLGVAQLIHEAEYYVAAERNFFVQLKWELE